MSENQYMNNVFELSFFMMVQNYNKKMKYPNF